MIVRTPQKIQSAKLYVCLVCLLTLLVSGCSLLQPPEQLESKPPDYGNPPTLSGLTISPNPARPGTVVTLTVNYVDSDSDLSSGLAAISTHEEHLSSIAFRTTYPSGLLTLPFPVSQYARQSDIRIILKVRDDAGNWSNSVSAILAVR